MKQLFTLLLVLSVASVVAQQQLPAGQNYYDEQSGIIYNQELSVDFRLITPRAFALGVNVGKLVSYDRTTFFNFEFGDIRHPQEYRQSFDFQFGPSNRVSRAFIYGKQNSAFVLRAGYGEKRYFSEKAKNRGLAVGVTYQVGVNLGLVKPYYLELLRSSDPGRPNNGFFVSEEAYSPENENIFLDLSRIIGAASFSRGLEDLQVLPGFHAKAAAHFDWGAFDELVKAIEAGIMVDVFLQELPIMVESPMVPHLDNSPVLINLYLNLQLGKRW